MSKMTIRRGGHGDSVSLLGYGMMRLPTVDGSHANTFHGGSNAAIDQDLVNRQTDRALELGVNYFDTSPAYCRGESERVTGAALARHAIPDIVNYEIFHARYHVEIVKSEIGVENAHPLAEAGDIRAEISRDRGLAHSAFARSYNYFPCHRSFSVKAKAETHAFSPRLL